MDLRDCVNFGFLKLICDKVFGYLINNPLTNTAKTK